MDTLEARLVLSSAADQAGTILNYAINVQNFADGKPLLVCNPAAQVSADSHGNEEAGYASLPLDPPSRTFGVHAPFQSSNSPYGRHPAYGIIGAEDLAMGWTSPANPDYYSAAVSTVNLLLSREDTRNVLQNYGPSYVNASAGIAYVPAQNGSGTLYGVVDLGGGSGVAVGGAVWNDRNGNGHPDFGELLDDVALTCGPNTTTTSSGGRFLLEVPNPEVPSTIQVSGAITMTLTLNVPTLSYLTLMVTPDGVVVSQNMKQVAGPPPRSNPLIARADTASVQQGQVVSIPVTANDTIPPGTSPSVVTSPSRLGASVSVSGNVITYVAGGAGTDELTYTVSAGGQSATATVTVDVTARPQDPPIVAPSISPPRIVSAGLDASGRVRVELSPGLYGARKVTVSFLGAGTDGRFGNRDDVKKAWKVRVPRGAGSFSVPAGRPVLRAMLARQPYRLLVNGLQTDGNKSVGALSVSG